MDEKLKSVYFFYTMNYCGKDRVKIKITARPRSEKIEIKYATLQEPDKIIDFDQLNRVISIHFYQRGDKIAFYIINEKTMQKEKVFFDIDWKFAPKYNDKTIEVPDFRGDLTKVIRKIGG